MSEARLPIHPYAAIFPAITSPDFDHLCGCIARQGLLEAIILHEGKVLDGWHRYLACLVKQVPPRFRDYAGEGGSPLHFVVAKNIDRRHLTPGQRALVAARLKPLFEQEARQRQRAPLKQGTELPVGENSPPREKQEEKGRSAQEQRTELPVGENSPQREKHEEKGRSAQKAAELMKVSDFSVKAADQVKKQGVPQLVDALAAGRVSVSAAARIARLPPEQQQAVVAGIDNGLKANQALAQVQETFAKDQAGWVDDDGRPLPEGIIPAFRQRAELWNLCRRIEAFSRNVERLGNTPVSGHLDVQQVLTALEAVRHTLWAAQPARVCPQHPGEEAQCGLCRGLGWLPAGMRENTAA